MVSTDGKILDANRAALKTLGYKKDFLIGKPLETIYAPEIHPRARRLFKQWLQNGYIKNEELTIIAKNGTERTVLLSANAVRNDLGEIVHSISVHKDITDFKNAVEQIRRAKADWDNMFQAIGHPTFILDHEHRILAANRAVMAAIRKSEDEILNKKCYTLFHGKKTPPKDCPLEKVKLSGHLESIDVEVEVLGRTYLVSCTPIYNEKGSLEKVIHIATNTTERKKAEAALRKTKDTIQTYLDIAGVMFIVIDARGKTVIVIKRGARFLDIQKMKSPVKIGSLRVYQKKSSVRLGQFTNRLYQAISRNLNTMKIQC